jgi:hypothetical protein
LVIDRTNFYEIGKPQMLQLFDGISRIISKQDPWRSEKDDGIDGLRTITKLVFTIDALSSNPNDNIFSFDDSQTFYINIKTFFTHLRYENDEYFNYDLREPKRKIIRPDKVLQQTNKVVTNTDDWSNIPYYPTTREKRMQTMEYLIKTGKQVPVDLLRQIQKDKEDSIKNDVYNINTLNVDDVRDAYNGVVNNQRKYRPQPPSYTRQPQHPPPHKYSPQYANYIGAPQRASASASAKIRLGGVY